eukprot:6458946-Amphidinium_carterae.1
MLGVQNVSHINARADALLVGTRKLTLTTRVRCFGDSGTEGSQMPCFAVFWGSEGSQMPCFAVFWVSQGSQMPCFAVFWGSEGSRMPDPK